MKKFYLIFIFLVGQLHADINVFIMAGQSNSSRMSSKILKSEIRKKFPHSTLFKYDKEGSNLYQQWKGDGTNNIQNDGEIYKTFQTKWKLFVKKIQKKHPQQTLNLQGLFWMQGEADGFGKKSSQYYYKNLKRFMQDLRVTLKHKNLPIIIGRLSNQQTAVTHLKTIQKAQNKAGTLKNTAIANLNNIPCSDNLHFKNHYKQVAKRFVNAMHRLRRKRIRFLYPLKKYPSYIKK